MQILIELVLKKIFCIKCNINILKVHNTLQENY